MADEPPTGSSILFDHLGRVETFADQDIHDPLALDILAKSVKKLRKRIEDDREEIKSIDLYATKGLDPRKAVRGPLVAATQLRVTTEEWEAAVARLLDAGWILPLQMGKATTYRFAVGGPIERPV